MDAQAGPSGSKLSITVFPEMQPRHSEPGIPLPQLLPLLKEKKKKKDLRESFHEFISPKSYLLNFYLANILGARF